MPKPRLRVVDARDRFDNTRFSTEIVDGTTASIYSTYTCPNCAATLTLQKRNFEQKRPEGFSNLPSEIANEIGAFAKEKVESSRYLDWVCPQCGLAARVYFTEWAGGRHGDSGFDLECVIEAAPNV